MNIKILRAENVKAFIEEVKKRYKKEIKEDASSSIEFLPLKENTKKEKNETIKIISKKQMLEDLKAFRKEIAKEYNMYPIYYVYNNKELELLIEHKPKSMK